MHLLWRHWPRLSRELERARHVALLLDFDGTLAPIVNRPEQARLLPEARSALLRLAARDRCTIGFFSGRSLRDLQRRVDVPHCFYAGNHGLEWMRPRAKPVRTRLSREARMALRRIKGLVGRELGHVPGIVVEDKGLGLSVHFRLVPRSFARPVREYLGWLSGRPNRMVECHRGKKVLEIRPVGGPDKGRVVQTVTWAVEKQTGVKPLTFYFGDDEGDEPAFAVVAPAGYGVSVGRPKAKSAARFWVSGPPQVAEFLHRVADCLALKEAGRA